MNPAINIPASAPGDATAVPKTLTPEVLTSAIQAAAMQAPLVNKAATPETPGASPTAVTKSYQFPSAPNSFEFTGARTKTLIPDGIYTTSDPKEIEELDAAVECGNIWPFTGEFFSSRQIPPPPIDPSKTN